MLPIFCFAVTSFAFVQGKREGVVLEVLCWPYYSEVILLRLVLLNFIILLFYPQRTRAVDNVLSDLVSWVSTFVFNLFHCSLQVGTVKVVDCLSRVTVQLRSLANIVA